MRLFGPPFGRHDSVTCGLDSFSTYICVQVALDRKGRQQVPISLKTDTCRLTEGSPTGQHAKNHDKASGVCKPKRQQIRQSHEWAWTEKHRGHGSPHAKESPMSVIRSMMHTSKEKGQSAIRTDQCGTTCDDEDECSCIT